MPESLEQRTTKSTLLVGRNQSSLASQRAKDLCCRLGVTQEQWGALRRQCQSAKDRCTNPNNSSYANYGARGVRFEFPAGLDMAVWVLENLGPRPSAQHSIDRADNERGYAPGNLRWADRHEQSNNKRRYECWKYGDRIAKLADARRDLSYETIRTWINRGLTDDEIINKPKGAGGRPSVRHRKLRATKSLRG